MCLASNRTIIFSLAFLGLVVLPNQSFGEGGVVTVVGAGKDSGEALNAALRTAITRNLKNDQELIRSVQPGEISPNANSFIQSYRLIEGGRAGVVSVSANIDLDVVRALVGLTPIRLGEEGAKALVAVRGFSLPETAIGKQVAGVEVDPFSALVENAKLRLERRSFQVVVATKEDLSALGPEENVASIEVLRGLAARVGARVAIGVSAQTEMFENENSHNREERVVVRALILDARQGVALAKVSTQAPVPKSKRDQYVTDLQKNLVEESRELFHELFVEAGKRMNRKSGNAGFMVLRVQYPSAPATIQKFRGALEAAKGIRSVTELQFFRGALDFAVSPSMEPSVLAKTIQGLAGEDFQVTILEPFLSQEEKRVPALLVKVAPKVLPGGGVEEKRSNMEAEDVHL
jgi:hypothetical protein